MSRASDGKCLLEWMRKEQLDEFGSVILGCKVQEIIGIEMPEIADKKTFDRLALKELNAVDYVRNVLLGEGKYLMQHLGNYRIILPSENAAQIEQYMNAADNKLGRALKLSRNTPPIDEPLHKVKDNTAVRIMMKQESIKAHRS